MIYEQETLRTWHLRNCIEAVDGECIPILHQADSGTESFIETRQQSQHQHPWCCSTCCVRCQWNPTHTRLIYWYIHSLDCGSICNTKSLDRHTNRFTELTLSSLRVSWSLEYSTGPLDNFFLLKWLRSQGNMSSNNGPERKSKI